MFRLILALARNAPTLSRKSELYEYVTFSRSVVSVLRAMQVVYSQTSLAVGSLHIFIGNFCRLS